MVDRCQGQIGSKLRIKVQRIIPIKGVQGDAILFVNIEQPLSKFLQILIKVDRVNKRAIKKATRY